MCLHHLKELLHGQLSVELRKFLVYLVFEGLPEEPLSVRVLHKLSVQVYHFELAVKLKHKLRR